MALAQPPRSVRNLSPGNLKAPTEEKGRSWWEGFVGLDKDGFARFEDAKSGIQALLQQIGIDKGRDLDLGQFIEKYVGKTADPKGTANALRNIPQILGVGLDTLLTEIPSDSLARAITQNEGGAAATDAFDIPDDAPELDQKTLAEELGGAVADPASDIPLIYRMDQREAKPSQVSGSDTLRVAPRKLEIGKEIFTAEADKPYPDYRSGIITTQESVFKTPYSRTETVRLTPEEAKRRIGPQYLGDPGGGIAEADLSGVFDAKVEDTDATVEDTDATEEVKPKVGAPYLPLGQVADVQTQAEAEKPSFLSRIGGAIKNNPMVASQIAQVVGGIGSGILGGRRMAKEQAKSARRQREAMNMANAISTLTRGRTQPAVAPRPVISKPGGAETIFDILGTLGQGGAQITQGIQQREEAAEDRRRAQEMEDFQKEYMTRGLDIEELKVKGEMREQQIAAQIERIKSIEPVGPEDFNPLEPGEGNHLRKTLNELKALHAEGGPFTTGYLHQWVGDRHWGGAAKLQQTFDAKRNMLIGIVKDVMGLGRLTDRDLRLVQQTLPELDDTERQVEGKIDGILGTLDRLEQRSAGVLGLGAGAFAGTGGDYSGMTNEELEKLLEADPGNEAVVAVMQDRLREDN